VPDVFDDANRTVHLSDANPNCLNRIGWLEVGINDAGELSGGHLSVFTQSKQDFFPKRPMTADRDFLATVRALHGITEYAMNDTARMNVRV
jgi:hypothetical protein